MRLPFVALLLLTACNTVTAYDLPEGPAERTAVEVVETIQPGELLRVTATCPEDAPRLVLGGCTFGGYQGSITPVTNAPEVPQVDGTPVDPAEVTTWVCTGYNTDPDLPGAITATAVCEVER